MAEETIVTNIVANANFSGLISDLNRVSASLANLQTQVSATNKSLAAQISVVNRKFGDTLRSTGQFTTHFATVGSDVEKFGKSLDKGQLKLRDYYRTWQTHSKTTNGLIRDLAQQQVRLQNAIMQPLGRNAEGMMQFAVHVPKGLDLIKNKTALAHQELMIMNRVMQEGANQLINWGKNTQWAGRQLTVGLTLPLAAFGKAAADAFKTADEQLTRLTKVYGDIAGASAQELGTVRKEVAATAKELAGSLGASFNDTLALGADIAATGKQGEELLGSIRETTRLSVLGEVDRQEAMKATLAIQSAFNQNTTELAESINFLNAVENQTSTTLNDLVEAIPKAGPVIKGLGGSVQDLALYLTAMREGGINASEGANALKSALGALINPTDIAVEKFKGFGIDLLGIVNDNAGNVTNTLLALQSALDTLNPLQKQQAIEQLFGRFQFSRLNALFDNLGRQGSQTLQVLDLMKASSADLANIAGRELSMVTESASGKYRRAIEELKADLASVGEQFLKINTYVIQFIDKIVNFAGNLPKPIKSILSLLGGLTAIAGPLIMLTGVLGNFFGYIVKGVYHFKSLFKGAEGWRMLTPEILAANKAGSMAESTFYSDAKAATILNQALQDLVVQYDSLAARAASGAISVNPIISTLGGNIVSTGAGPRVVDPNHPLVGDIDTRASAHMVPRGVQQPGTIFGLVPSSTPVNLAVRDNPQLYMQEALPPIPGLTTVQTKKYGQISTGIVASEAARHHAMTATLAMQSTEELVRLRKMMKDTGTVTTEFMQTFDDIVPITSQITQNAAAQSAAIVAELRAGKLSLAQAREKIIALNIEIENMLAQATGAYAQSTGRTINLTNVPTLNQPVVGPTGKSNMRELFKKRTGGFFSNIARALGVRTYGAGYNIETTRPRKLNMGGNVYFNNGDQVPGPNVNADVVPAMLTPGEFVIRRGIAQQDPEGMRMLNAGRAMIIPTFNMGGMIPGVQRRFAGGSILRILSALTGWAPNIARGARRVYDSAASNSPRAFDPGISYGPEPYQSLYRKSGAGWKAHGGLLRYGERKANEVLGHVITSKFLRQFGSARRQGSSVVLSGSQIEQRYGMMPGGGAASKEYQILPDNLITITKDFNSALTSRTATGAMWLASSRQPQHMVSLISHLLNAGVPYNVAYRVAGRTLTRINKAMQNLGNRPLTETKWGNIVDDAMSREIKQLQSSYKKASMYSFNRGGMVPGYINGGAIAGISRAGLLARLGAKFKYEGKMYDGPEALQTYRIKAMDINGGRKYFGHIEGISDKTRGALYDATLRYFNTSMMRGDVINGKRMFTPAFFQTAFPAIAQFALTSGKSWMPPADIAYLESISKKSGDLRGSVGSSIIGLAKVRNKIFGANKGGMVPGYQRGGMITSLRMKGYWPGAAASKLNYTDEGELLPGPVPREMSLGSNLMLGMAGSSIGGVAGGAIGGQAGALIGSMAGYSLPSLITKIISATKSAGGFLKIAMSIGKFLKMWSIPGTILTVLGLGAKALLDWKKRAEDAGKANRLAFGGTAESFASVGINNYTTMADRIKNINEQLELHRAQVRSTYESYTKAGPTGLTLTIEELKKAIENAKTAQKDYVDAFNNIDSSRVVQYATQLKAQFVAMGMSASEATNQIYAIVKASDKASQAVSAISSKSFRSIQKQTDGIKTLVDGLNKELTSKAFNPEEFTVGLDTLLNSLMTYQKGLVGTKDEMKNIIDEADALKLTIDQVSEAQNGTTRIAGDQLEQIKNQNITYQSILGNVESIQSIYAKIALYEQGFGRMLDLAKMTAKAAVDFAKNLSEIQNGVNAITETIGSANPLSPLSALIAKVEKQSKNAMATIKSLKKIDQDYYDAKIKIIQKSIDALEEERKKRLELLRAEKESSDFATTIEQSQNRLKSLIASGNMEAAAQEQLNIKKLSQERQYNVTVDAINAKFDKERKAKEEELARQQEAKDRLSKGLQSAQTTAAQKTADLATLKSYRDRIEEIAIRNIGKGTEGISKNDLKEVSNIIQEMKKAGGETAKAAKALEAQYSGKLSLGETISSKIITEFNSSISARSKSDGVFESAVKEFVAAVEKFKGQTNTEGKTSIKVMTGSKPSIRQVSGESLLKEGISTTEGTKFRASDGKQYEITKGNGKNYFVKPTGRWSFGAVVPGREYIVGERGPELFKTNISGSINPMYNIPNDNYRFNSFGNNGTMRSISLVQHINAAPGMDERMLANLAAKQAALIINDQNQATIFKSGRSVRVQNA